MTRRDLLKLLFASAVAEAIDVEKLLWTPKPIIVVPEIPISLYGIPYHQSNAFTGEWLGISRAEVYPELTKLIKLMQEEKKHDNLRSSRGVSKAEKSTWTSDDDQIRLPSLLKNYRAEYDSGS